jgi:negative regulator of replication initiation
MAEKATLESEADRAARIEKMKAEVQAFEAEQAEKREQAVRDAVKPARDLAESDALAKLIAEADAARISVARFSQLSSLLDNIVQSARLLSGAIDRAEAEARAALIAEAAPVAPPAVPVEG